MTDSKHTPGPWFYDPERHPHHYGCNVGAESGENIATVHPGENGAAETIANARLIAASPELLVALEHSRQFILAHWVDHADRPKSDAQRQRIIKADEMVRAAIAKAKGE